MDNKELMHHGILGQKWGVRRYQNEDGSLTSEGRERYRHYDEKRDEHIAKIATSSTRLFKNYHNARASAFERRSEISRKLKEETTFGDKFSTAVGSGFESARASARSGYYSRKAEYSKTRLGKTINESRAHNEKEISSVYKQVHDARLVDKLCTEIDAISSAPLKTFVGRDTTAGKNFIENVIGIGLIRDIKYYNSTSPKHFND